MNEAHRDKRLKFPEYVTEIFFLDIVAFYPDSNVDRRSMLMRSTARNSARL